MSDNNTNDKPRTRRNDVGTLKDRTDRKAPVGFTGTVKVGLDIVDIQFIRVADVPDVEKVFERSASAPEFVIFELPDPKALDESSEFLKTLEFSDNMGVAWVRERSEGEKTLDISFDLGVLGRHRAQGLPKDGNSLRICVTV